MVEIMHFQIFCNKTGVKNILDVFEISAFPCNPTAEKSVKKSLWSWAASPPREGQGVGESPSPSPARGAAQGQRPRRAVLWAGSRTARQRRAPEPPGKPRKLGEMSAKRVGCEGAGGGLLCCRIKHPWWPLETSPVRSGAWELLPPLALAAGRGQPAAGSLAALPRCPAASPKAASVVPNASLPRRGLPGLDLWKPRAADNARRGFRQWVTPLARLKSRAGRARRWVCPPGGAGCLLLPVRPHGTAHGTGAG